jgi:hypothetical protein
MLPQKIDFGRIHVTVALFAEQRAIWGSLTPHGRQHRFRTAFHRLERAKTT